MRFINKNLTKKTNIGGYKHSNNLILQKKKKERKKERKKNKTMFFLVYHPWGVAQPPCHL